MNQNLVGSMLGGYEILSMIGEGAMGAVFKARETLLHRVVAIKVIHKAFASQRESVDRFFREALLHANLNHPNIVTIYSAGIASGHPYIAMEYVDGTSLSDFLRSQGRLPARAAVEFMQQLCGAVAAAHGAGIVHRDLKPQNILMDALGTIKLMDFGIARGQGVELQQLTRKGQVMGTPAYMSPQQVMGEQVDERADIYSLGVIFYQMLTQRLPHDGSTPVAIIHKKLTESFVPVESLVPDLPENIRKIINKSITIEPKDRFPSVRAMKAVLDMCVIELDFAGFLV